MGALPQAPTPCERTITWTSSSRILCGIMHDEDSIACQDFFVTRQLPNGATVFVILDGHGPNGDAIAAAASEALLAGIEDRMARVENTRESRERALLGAFAAAAEVVDGREDAAGSGTTASLVFVDGNIVTVANVGDSGVYLARGGTEALLLSKVHRGQSSTEKRRVEECGGVFYGEYLSDRDGGRGLSVTRALGDLEMRSLGVVSEPEVTEVQVTDEEFLILATDGLWDAHGGIEGQKAVDVVGRVIGEEGGTKMGVDELTALAKGRGRLPFDDLAVTVVKQLVHA